MHRKPERIRVLEKGVGAGPAEESSDAYMLGVPDSWLGTPCSNGAGISACINISTPCRLQITKKGAEAEGRRS